MNMISIKQMITVTNMPMTSLKQVFVKSNANNLNILQENANFCFSVCTVYVLMFGLYLNFPLFYRRKSKKCQEFESTPDKNGRQCIIGLWLFRRLFVVVDEKHVHFKRWVWYLQNLPPIRPFLTSGIVEKNHRIKSWGFGCLVGIWWSSSWGWCHGRHDWCHGHDWSSYFFRWWKFIPWLLAVFKDPISS